MLIVVSLVRKAPSANAEFGEFINDSHDGRTCCNGMAGILGRFLLCWAFVLETSTPPRLVVVLGAPSRRMIKWFTRLTKQASNNNVARRGRGCGFIVISTSEQIGWEQSLFGSRYTVKLDLPSGCSASSSFLEYCQYARTIS